MTEIAQGDWRPAIMLKVGRNLARNQGVMLVLEEAQITNTASLPKPKDAQSTQIPIKLAMNLESNYPGKKQYGGRLCNSHQRNVALKRSRSPRIKRV